MTTEAKIKIIIKEHLGVQEVKPDDNLVNDLGADSLDKIEIALEIEEIFGISIEDDVMDSWVMVQDCVDTVKKMLGTDG